MAEPGLTAGIITLLFSTGGLWIREYFKFRALKRNNGGIEIIASDIIEIKSSTKSLDLKTHNVEKDVGIIKTEMKNIHDNCQKYEKGISQNARDILSLHKEKADK